LGVAKQLIRIAIGDATDIVIERDVLIAGVRMTAQIAGRIAIDCHGHFLTQSVQRSRCSLALI
jgi:hypothetical protein